MIAEEFGLVGASAVLCLFVFFSVRVSILLTRQTQGYVVLAATGLIAQFTMQVLINMGSSLRIIPTKGMTLPFLSYGGSSLLATAVGAGVLLALLRHQASSVLVPVLSGQNFANSTFAIRFPSSKEVQSASPSPNLRNRGVVS